MAAKANDVTRVISVYYILRNDVRQDTYVGSLESGLYIQEDGSLVVNARGVSPHNTSGSVVYAAGIWLKYTETTEKGGDLTSVDTKFRMGAQAFREMAARYIAQGGDRVTAQSIRSYWHTSSWGEDPGPLARD